VKCDLIVPEPNVGEVRYCVEQDSIVYSDGLKERISQLFLSLRLPLYRYFLVTLGNAAEAEDMTQECFFRLYRYLHTGKQVDNPKFWLFHVAHNLSIDRNKSSKILREVEPPSWKDLFESRSDPAPNPEERLIESERYQIISDVMKKLSDQQREVLTLRAEGLGYREIGEILSLNMPTVAAHVRRGIAKIKARANGK